MDAITLLLLVAFLAAPQAASKPSAHRLQLVRATDQTPIAGAELFDFDFDRERSDGFLMAPMLNDPDLEFPRRAHREVADGDGFVELGPGSRHALLARAPGWFQLDSNFDLAVAPRTKLELIPDDAMTIDVRNAHDEPVEGAFVELWGASATADGDPHPDWRVASDRSGRVRFPHYGWWMSTGFMPGLGLELAIPVREPQRFDFLPLGQLRTDDRATPIRGIPPVVEWRLPRLSTVHVEFEGTAAPPATTSVTFELIGPTQRYCYPNRFASRDGEPLDVQAEIGVPLRARFWWSEADAGRETWFERFASGRASTEEGGVATLHVSVARDPVALRVRPIRGDGAPLAAIARNGKPVRFDVAVDWEDTRGFTWRDVARELKPDETGAIRFEWPRPRLSTETRPARIHVALLQVTGDLRIGASLGPEPDLAARDLQWPTGGELDIGTLIVPLKR